MPSKHPFDLRPEAEALVDDVIETMRSHGVDPDVSEEMYERTVVRVSRAVEDVWSSRRHERPAN